MRILIDIGHPAHVHLFKCFTEDMLQKGHEILFTCRKKEFEIELLKNLGFKYYIFGKKYITRIGKIWGLFEFGIKEWAVARNFKPDLFLSHGSMYAAYASFLSSKPHISFEDTFNKEQVRLYLPFTDCILTSTYEHPMVSNKKVVKYSGYHELAYLHPKRFEPNKKILSTLGLKENEKYVLLRFVAWSASHDKGHSGISIENKLNAVREFSKFGKVFISAESNLPKDLEKYRLSIKPELFHDVIAFAEIVIGESFTVLAEAAVLGVPGILIHNTKSYYLSEMQDRYGLVFNFSEKPTDQLSAINKGVELLSSQSIKSLWADKKEKMLQDKIDVTAFLIWFVENYPESHAKMKKEPKYYLNFR